MKVRKAARMAREEDETGVLTPEIWRSWPPRKRARTMNSLSGFKSATLVGTSSEEGAHNLSIVSSVVHLGSTPALMGMVLRPPGADSHTYRNLCATQQCTFSHVNTQIYQQAHQCSARYPKNVSEFTAVGLTPWTPSVAEWIAPAVSEASIRLGLNLEDDIVLPNDCHLMVCSLQWAVIPENVRAPDGYVDIGAAETVTISGLDGYHQTSPLGRLSYAKVGESVRRQADVMEGWED